MRKRPTLTDAQRQARRETILQVKPWTKATGPKTQEGKARAAQRWRKHGMKSAEARAARAWLRSIRMLVKALQSHG